MLPTHDRRELAAIFAGGIIGSLARTGLARPPDNAEWPWATFAVNVAGAFLLGYFATRLRNDSPPPPTSGPFSGPACAAR